MRNLFANAKYIFKNTLRSPIKSSLIAGFALLSILALTYLQHVITTNEAEINRLYDEFVVSGEFVASNPLMASHDIGNVVTQIGVDILLENEFISHVYLESGVMEVGFAPHDMTDFDALAEIRDEFTHWALSFNDFEVFVASNMATALDGAVGVPIISDYTGDFYLNFGAGFSEADFVFDANRQIAPIILHETLLQQHGFTYGDYARLVNSRLVQLEVQVIGSFTGGRIEGIARFDRPMILLPVCGLEHMLRRLSYNTVRFYTDTAFNRELARLREEMQAIIITPGSSLHDMLLILNDDELRLVIGPLEQNLLLLQLLYPVALVVVIILAAGLAVLIMLQSTKIAAIMRSLGSKKALVRLLLSGEYIVICIFGAILGIVLMPIIGISLSPAILIPAALYLTGALVGAVIGAVLNTNRSVLELLQVKE